MCLLAVRSAATCKRAWLSLAWRSSHRPRHPRRCWMGRAAIVSISASDCRIAAAIHNSLAIAPADADPRWYFARRSGSSQGA